MHGERRSVFLRLLLRSLIHTDKDRIGDKHSVVYRQHILHRIDDIRIGLERKAPNLFQPGFNAGFFKGHRTVSVDIKCHQPVTKQLQCPTGLTYRRV